MELGERDVFSMKYGTITNRLRAIKGRFTITEAMRATGATYIQTHQTIHKLKRQGELKLVRKGDIGRFAKKKSVWKISA